MKILNKFKVMILIIIIGTIIILIRNANAHTKSIADIAENNKYNLQNTLMDSKTAKITIDFDNIASVENEVVYSKDEYKIIIKKVELEKGTSNFKIYFDSYGKYSKAGASLVSGISYSRPDNNAFKSEVVSDIEFVDSNTYKATVIGVSPLCYKNGDNFGFYIHNLNNDKLKTLSFYLKNLCFNEWE